MDDMNLEADDKRKREFEDLELIVEGRTIKTNSALMCYNSSVLATLISNARATRTSDENDEIWHDMRNKSKKKLKLELPNLKYKDVKLMVSCIQSNTCSKENITGVEALYILPLADYFRIQRLKSVCSDVLYDSLVAVRAELGVGNIARCDVIKYLVAADQYNLEKVRKICIEELSIKTDASSRKQITKDEHITDGTKLDIMVKVCENMEKDYEDNLKQARTEMDQGCRETEQRKEEFIQHLEIWKTNLRSEVDDMVSRKEDIHKQSINDLGMKKITKHMDETLKETKVMLVKEMSNVKQKINSLLISMEKLKKMKKEEMERLKKSLEEYMENNTKEVERIADSLENKMSLCYLSKENVHAFTSAKELEENVCQNFKEWEKKMQTLTEDQIKYKEEVTLHEKTKAELMKMKKKEHKLNTWINWATPLHEDERKCHCFRHFLTKQNVKI